MILDANQENIIGNVTLFKDAVRQQTGSERKLIKTCLTEDERVETLREIYGIDLTGEERDNISSDNRLA